MKKYLYLSTAIVGVMIGGNVWAQCVSTQDCTALGYTETSCPNGGVKCPFGNKWFCGSSDENVCKKYGFIYTCTGTGYTSGNGKSCNEMYAACNCDSEYKWQNGICEKMKNGAEGNLYYCDGTVVAVKGDNMDFYIALHDLSDMEWGDAVDACRSYVFCKDKKGYLPSGNQLLSLKSNESQLRSLLSTYGGSPLTGEWYWSSSLAGGDYSHKIVVRGFSSVMSWGSASDGTRYSVRPVIR